MSTPGSSARGLDHAIYLVSFSHGSVQLPVLKSMSLDFSMKEEVTPEMGTNRPVLNTQFFEKAPFQLDYEATDDNTFLAYLMDAPPSSAQGSVYVPYLTFQAPFSLYGNQKHMLTGKIMESFVAAQCFGTATFKQSAQGKLEVSVKGTATWGLKSMPAFINSGKGTGAVSYSRIVSSAPPYAGLGDISFSGSSATLPQTAAAFPLPGTGGNTQNYMLVLKNGIPVTTGFTISGTTFTVSTAPATTDVWEVFILYLP